MTVTDHNASMKHSRLVAVGLAVGAIGVSLLGAGCAEPRAARPVATTASGQAGARKPCRPEYPVEALRAKAQGTTVMRFTIDTTGAVTKSEILQSAGPTPEHRLLDVAAATALFSCPFKPGTDAAGMPAGTTVEVTYRWLLEQPVVAPVPAASH